MPSICRIHILWGLIASALAACQQDPTRAKLTDGGDPTTPDAGESADAGLGDAASDAGPAADAGRSCPAPDTTCSPEGWCGEFIDDDVKPVVTATGYFGWSPAYPGYSGTGYYWGGAVILRQDNSVLLVEPPGDWSIQFKQYDPALPLRAAVYLSDGDSQSYDSIGLLVGDGILLEEHCRNLPCVVSSLAIPERMRGVSVHQNSEDYWWSVDFEGWAVGDAIFRWTSAGWSREYDPGDLLEGVVSRRGVMFAVGKGAGTIVRHDDAGWHEEMPVPGLSTDVRFHAIKMRSTGGTSWEVVAVGDGGLVVAWQDGVWRRIQSPTTERLLQVTSRWVRGEKHVYRLDADALVEVPNQSAPAFLLNDPTDDTGWWTLPGELPLTAGLRLDKCGAGGCSSHEIVPATRRNLKSAVASETHGTWTVSDTALAFRREQDHWRRFPANLSTSDVKLRGSEHLGVWALGSQLSQFNGRNWQEIQNARDAYEYSFRFTDLLVDDNQTEPVLFVEHCSHGYPYECWVGIEGPASDEFRATFPTGVWGVQRATRVEGGVLALAREYLDDGINYRYMPVTFSWDGTTWTDHGIAPSSMATLWAASIEDAWGISHEYDPTSPTWWRGRLWRWNGAWTPVDVPGARPTDVWGRASDDVWVVGEGGLILHWDGLSWTRQDSGTTQNLYAVTGRDDAVWAVGECETIRGRSTK